ncbi:hypothetical protein ACIQMR_37300 [Streptomyces sp. NPDC091376]|uniref:hypothetical protein n=1 Tax=Streptomyces sp. NPDC091376 TaxID=3365994 RepID=UPI0037FA3698
MLEELRGFVAEIDGLHPCIQRDRETMWNLVERYDTLRLSAPPGCTLPQSAAHMPAPLDATQEIIDAIRDEFVYMINHLLIGVALPGSPAMRYLDEHSTTPGDLADPRWFTADGIAKAIRNSALDLGFSGSGCALLTHCVIESLKGSPTVPSTLPEAGTFSESMSRSMYGEGARCSGKDELANLMNHTRPGDIYRVNITGPGLFGHAVAVLRTADGALYLDPGLGGGRREVCGPLQDADWLTKWGFNVFEAVYVGKATTRWH